MAIERSHSDKFCTLTKALAFVAGFAALTLLTNQGVLAQSYTSKPRANEDTPLPFDSEEGAVELPSSMSVVEANELNQTSPRPPIVEDQMQMSPMMEPKWDPEFEGMKMERDDLSAKARDMRRVLEGKRLLDEVVVNPDTEMKTVMMTLWQYNLIKDAEMEYRTRPPTQTEVEQSSTPDGKTTDRPAPTGPTILNLGGISYVSNDRWTVWLNGKRITPEAIPVQVLDISVTENYVEMKWFDDHSNMIFPIRLRPHQRFSFSNRVFLPGTDEPAKKAMPDNNQ